MIALIAWLTLAMTTATTDTSEWLSPSELASWLGVPVRTVYDWLQRDQAPRSYKIGRHRRFRRTDVEDWLAKRVDA